MASKVSKKSQKPKMKAPRLRLKEKRLEKAKVFLKERKQNKSPS